MVKIRLARFGKKGEPHYRLVAIQAREKRESKAIEYLGYYNPRTKPSTVDIKKERVEYWLSVGAQPTETVAYLLSKEGLYKIEQKKKYSKKPGKKKTERAKQAKEGKKEAPPKEDKQEEKEEDKAKEEQSPQAEKKEDTSKKQEKESQGEEEKNKKSPKKGEDK